MGDGGRQAVLTRRIRWLVASTIGYNVGEALVAVTAGSMASSTALIGFGLDSAIEVTSAATVAWQFSGADPHARERTALRVIGLSFFALAGYLAVESIRALAGAGEARPSPVGIVLAAVSLLVMPALSVAQRRAGPRAWLGHRGRRRQAGPALHLPVGSAPGRPAAQRPVRPELGRPGGGAGHRRRRGQRGPPGLARRQLLLSSSGSLIQPTPK